MALGRQDLDTVGRDLRRPECVLATASGHLCAADFRGGVTVIAPSGQQHFVGSSGSRHLRPNGIALTATGDFLVAHLGDDSGGLFHLASGGACRPLVTEVDGEPLPPSNFPYLDSEGRICLTVSTRVQPRHLAYRAGVADGFIVRVEGENAVVVADNLGYTNECMVHPNGRELYVNETFARRLSRFTIRADNTLGPRQTVTEFGPGTFPDGLAFDEQGGAWITSIVSNRVIRVDETGTQTVMFEDADEAHVETVEQAYRTDSLGRVHLDRVPSGRLGNLSSLAFGGHERRTAYLGNLLDDSLHAFRSPIAGWPLAHWDVMPWRPQW